MCAAWVMMFAYLRGRAEAVPVAARNVSAALY